MSLQSNIMLEILRYAQDDTGEKLKIENGKLKINFALCTLHFAFSRGTPLFVILSFSEESSNNPAKQDFIHPWWISS